MADFEFEITDGSFAGRYELDLADFTAAEASAFRHAVGMSLVQVIRDGQADIDAVAGLVWLVRRRGGAKSLPFMAVAEHVSYGNIAPLGEAAPADEAGSLDPTTPPTTPTTPTPSAAG